MPGRCCFRPGIHYTMELSVIIPLFNESELIHELVSRTVHAIESLNIDYEIILVDDGSTDQTLALILQEREKNQHIKILQLSRNFGHQAAYTAGLHRATGNFAALLDGDLQDPPEVLIDMYKKIKLENLDVVYGRRSGDANYSKRPLFTWFFHQVFTRLSGFQDMENAGNFSILSHQAVQSLLTFKENNRYLPGLRKYIGYPQGFVGYERSDRYSGESKMTLSRLFRLSADAIFSFSKLPIRVCLYLGVLGIVIFFFAGLYTLIAKLAGFALIGWSSTVLSIYFLGSIQLTFLGVLGEYVYRIHKESQNRPLYFVKEFFG